jgi:thiaminase/transcriptional activator TenA
MSFSKRIVEDPRVQAYYDAYMAHPFIRGLSDGSLSDDRFRKYLIQDTHYLKDYSKVYAYAYLLGDGVRELQFLHACIGVVMAEETNMHIQYLSDFGLDVFGIERMPMERANRNYLDYMLSFAPEQDMKTIFTAAFPCTLAYGYIGKELKKERANATERHYYDPWIETYAGTGFEKFRADSCWLIDRYCEGISKEEEEELIQIFLTACEYEMKFWDMSYSLIPDEI